MALSPSIPTSFVPKQPVSTGPTRRKKSGNNIFLIVSLLVAAVTLLAAGGVFIYGSYLDSVVKAKSSELSTAQTNASASTVEDFIRLRNRFIAAQGILDSHVELSQFFTLLESITLQTVQYTSLKIEVADDHSATIEMEGTAQDFNSLAAESAAFAGQPYIKNAIFSNISVNPDNTVKFTIDANLDPRLVIESAPPATPALLPGATSSSTTAASLPTTVTTSNATVPSASTQTATTTTTP